MVSTQIAQIGNCQTIMYVGLDVLAEIFLFDPEVWNTFKENLSFVAIAIIPDPQYPRSPAAPG